MGRRTRVRRPATLVTSDGHELEVALIDVSADGFRIEHFGADLVVGEIVRISDGPSSFKAQLMWTGESEAGGAFVEESKVDH